MTDDAATIRVLRAREGDSGALEELWKNCRGWVGAVLLAHGAAAEAVEDLLQEVALRFVSRLHTLEDPQAFGAWMRTLAANVARGDGRRRSGAASSAGTAAAKAVDLEQVEDPMHARQQEVDATRGVLEQVMARVHALPLQFREPLLLKAVAGMSQHRVAEVLELSEAAVESRLARARRLLREQHSADGLDETTGPRGRQERTKPRRLP